jgi:tRNA dimethylallyltransferase
MKKIFAIVGPTGIGKSHLAVGLAQKIGAEIISADSRQIYRFMDTGTAKPGKQALSLVAHHLIDIINPDESFSLAEYQQKCQVVIDDVTVRGKLPLLVGGSGQYVWAVLEGWGIPGVAPDMEYRNMLEMRAVREGKEVLYSELQSLDPEAAGRIDRSNVRRVIRALEITRNSADNKSRQRDKSPIYDALIIGLTASRDELYRRIDSRVDSMIENGLVDEVKGLIKNGYSLDLPAMSGIGYKQIGMFLKGEIALESAIQQIKFETHRFVRSQYNWFKLKDDRIKWFDIQDDIEPDIIKLTEDFFGQKQEL